MQIWGAIPYPGVTRFALTPGCILSPLQGDLQASSRLLEQSQNDEESTSSVLYRPVAAALQIAGITGSPAKLFETFPSYEQTPCPLQRNLRSSRFTLS